MTRSPRNRERRAPDRRLRAPSTAPASPAVRLSIHVLLVASVLAVYHRVLVFQFVDLDDFTYVVRNARVIAGLTPAGIAWAFTHAYEGYWAPLTWLSYMADASLFGATPGAFHATNVVIHAATACLLFAALARMTGATWRSAVVAALFALHPLHVESVAWITERKDVLSAFWYVLALWLYVRYVDRPALGRYLLVAAAFACGLMSKPMVVTLPVALLLVAVWPLGRLRDTTWTRLVVEQLPLAAMAAGVGMVTIAAQSGAGAVATLSSVPVTARVANALVSCAVYLVQMAWPSGLAALYPYPRFVPAWQALAAAAALAAISIAVLRLRDRAPYLAVGWAWYLVTLVPVLGFVQAGPQARADRYTYVAMTGIAMAVVWGIAEATARIERRGPALAAAACGALALFAVVASTQLEYWRTSETLFRRALAVTTDNYVAHKGLGTVLLEAGRVEEATSHLRTAVGLAPDFAEAHSDLGEALRAAREPQAAIEHLARAVQLRPDAADFRVNLGSALYELARTPEAEAQYREALRLSPDSPTAHSGLGLALAQAGDLDGARSELASAVRLNPDYADAYLNLGAVLARAGQLEGASQAFSRFSKLQPDAPQGHISLGTLLARQGRISEAIDELTIAVRMTPADATLRSNLGILLVGSGRVADGLAHLSEAVRLRPDLPELRNNLDLAESMRK